MIFRLEKTHKQINVFIKDPQSGTFAKCFGIMNDGLEYKGYFAFSADNFDEQHVNDINLYSLNVYNTGGEKIEKSLRDDREINIDAKGSQDLLHKYQANQDGVNTMKVDLRDKDEPGKKGRSSNIKDIKKEDQNIEIMTKFREIQKSYVEHVDNFQKNIASIDSNTAQMIEFNKQKAQNMSLHYQNFDKKAQGLYQARVGHTQQGATVGNEKTNKLRDMIYSLDQKICKFLFHL